MRLLAYNKEKLGWLFCGCLMSMVTGAIFPLYAIFLGRIMIILALVDSPTFQSDVMNIVYWFIGLAFMSFIANILQSFCLTSFGEHLTTKVRCALYRKLLHMPIEFFDRPENSAGALSAKLATDAASVKFTCTDIIGIILHAMASFLCGLTVSVFYSWKLSLVCVAMFPLVLMAGKF
jgi:ABC-type multidrug transport system fused ATPase/permease subunit